MFATAPAKAEFPSQRSTIGRQMPPTRWLLPSRCLFAGLGFPSQGRYGSGALNRRCTSLSSSSQQTSATAGGHYLARNLETNQRNAGDHCLTSSDYSCWLGLEALYASLSRYLCSSAPRFQRRDQRSDPWTKSFATSCRSGLSQARILDSTNVRHYPEPITVPEGAAKGLRCGGLRTYAVRV